MYRITVPAVITNGHFNKEKTLAELKRSHADRIALALDRELDHAFSSEENLKLLEELLTYYRDNGLETIVWLGETFGHDGSPALPGSKYTHIKFIDKGEIQAFCPMDEAFANDFCSWVKKVAACGADMIMLDDDFRLGYRNGLGCCCHLHMAALEAELGEKVDEAELKQKLFDGGKNPYRDAWLKVKKDSMLAFAKKLRDALDTVNPDVRLGFCCSPSSWDADGWDVFEMAETLAGKTKPFIRTMGAPYWVTQWHWAKYSLEEVVEIERDQINRCRNRGIEVFTEGDTYPRPRHECPASYLECFDTILRADGSSDGILKYMLDYVSDADYETGYVDAMVKNLDLYQEIDRYFSGKSCIGVRPYNVLHLIERTEYDIHLENLLNELQDIAFYPSLKFVAANTLPVTYDGGFVNILFGENARYISEEELKQGAVIDFTAAKLLMQRGIDVGIEETTDAASYEKKGFHDTPWEYFICEDVYTRLSGGVFLADINCKPGVRPVTQYRIGSSMQTGAYEYENEKGMRFLVYPFDVQEAKHVPGWFESYARRRQLLKSIEWLAKKPLEAYVVGNHPRLYMMAKKDKRTLSIGLWNLFDDKIEHAKVKINCDYQDIRFINCSGHVADGAVILDTTLYPYEFAGFALTLR